LSFAPVDATSAAEADYSRGCAMDRKMFVDALVVLARHPDQGGNLEAAGQKIDEYLTLLQKSELGWMQLAIKERADHDRGLLKFFSDIGDLIKSRLFQLE
jgi:hypothetical protein